MCIMCLGAMHARVQAISPIMFGLELCCLLVWFKFPCKHIPGLRIAAPSCSDSGSPRQTASIFGQPWQLPQIKVLLQRLIAGRFLVRIALLECAMTRRRLKCSNLGAPRSPTSCSNPSRKTNRCGNLLFILKQSGPLYRQVPATKAMLH